MNAEMTQRVAKHGAKLLKLFPKAATTDPVELCLKIRRIETRCHRLALSLCNGTTQQASYERGVAKALYDLRALLGDSVHLAHVFVNGDPRGYALKIDDAYQRANNLDLPTDWGGYGLLAPDLS